MANPVTEKIKEILVPKLGEFITDSTLRVVCERIGTTSEEITKSQIPEFVENLKITLMLFFDDKDVRAISQKIVNIK